MHGLLRQGLGRGVVVAVGTVVNVDMNAVVAETVVVAGAAVGGTDVVVKLAVVAGTFAVEGDVAVIDVGIRIVVIGTAVVVVGTLVVGNVESFTVRVTRSFAVVCDWLTVAVAGDVSGL